MQSPGTTQIKIVCSLILAQNQHFVNHFLLASCSNRIVFGIMAAAITGDYYVGSITRAEAEEKVKLASHGDFVVRLDGDGHYSMIVNDSGGCTQYKIRLVDGTFQFGKNIFPSMDNLIETLRKKAIGSKSGVPIVLKNAAFTLKTTRPTGRQRPTADDRRRLAAAQGRHIVG